MLKFERAAMLNSRVWVVIAWLFFAIGPGQAQVLVEIGHNFTGTTYDPNAPFPVGPPDSNGAIGPRHFVEFINGAFTVYNRTNGESVMKISNKEFWTDAGVTLSTDAEVSDPRIIYDPST